MQIGMVGLGRMGYNLAQNMFSHGHAVVAYDHSPAAVHRAAAAGVAGANSLQELVDKLAPRRAVWLMVPAGEAVENLLEELAGLLEPGALVIDGGNSFYKDTLRRAKWLQAKGLQLVDVGTSGGMEGAHHGICAMVGAREEDFAFLQPLLHDISVTNGYLRCGPVGSGHYVKMVHNGIEYGMMQALGEGFEILAAGPFALDLAAVARVWNHGSVIRCWLMQLAAEAFSEDPQLERVRGVVHSSGEGLWTAQTALELRVPAPIITGSLFTRYRSEQEDSFAGKVAASLRNRFGGHQVESARAAAGAREGSTHGN